MAKKSDEDILQQARDDFERCREHWADNQKEAKEDLEFARLGKQWDTVIEQDRIRLNKPCETFNKMPTFIRQVVNDARQNKPAIKVHPQDAKADVRTAEIINGLIRNIETTSDADIAYDTAIEHAVGQGFGFWRINTAYTCDDAFDQDIVIERVTNPFTVFGDPDSTAADSSDWNKAFIATALTKTQFEAEYPDADKVDWEFDFVNAKSWLDGDNVLVAEYWTREKVRSSIVGLSDGTIMKFDEYQEHEEEFALAGITIKGQPREVESYKVTQRIMSGAEVLKTVEWTGKYIPIVPVYGDEVIDADGKRHFRSLIRDAKGSQKLYNYHRNTGAYLLSLQPRVPFIGPAGAFDGDENWKNVNSDDIAYLEYEGNVRPERQPPPQGAQAVMQEALNANDDMKAIIGIYDASLGNRSNETSGRAIMARQREGDVSTFHFIDNLSRAIRHGGRILLDLIPKVYSTARMVRILGEDLKPTNVQLLPGQPQLPDMNAEGKVIGGIFDLTAGKYDLTVSSGPSFTSRREEVSQILMEMMRSVPNSAVFLAGRLAKVLDLPDAEELGREMDMMNPAKQGQQVPQEVQQQMQQLQAEAAKVPALEQQLRDKRADAVLKGEELKIKREELAVKKVQALADVKEKMRPITADQEMPVPQGTA